MENKLSYEKQKNKLLVGITEDDKVVYIKIEIGSCGNNHFTITHDNMSDFISEEEGEEKAKETLLNVDYYVELGYLQRDCFINNFINFEDLADHLINSDGWENVNGEYTYFEDYEGKSYFMNFSSCGASIDCLKEDFKQVFITKEQKDILIKSDSLHLKDFDNYTKEEKEFFEKKVLPLFKLHSVDEKEVIPFLIGGSNGK